MSATPAAIEGRERVNALARDLAGIRVRAIAASGVALLLLALGLTVLVAANDVPSDGHAGTVNLLMRLAVMAALLPLGALMVARVPSRPSRTRRTRTSSTGCLPSRGSAGSANGRRRR